MISRHAVVQKSAQRLIWEVGVQIEVFTPGYEFDAAKLVSNAQMENKELFQKWRNKLTF